MLLREVTIIFGTYKANYSGDLLGESRIIRLSDKTGFIEENSYTSTISIQFVNVLLMTYFIILSMYDLTRHDSCNDSHTVTN